MLKNNCSEKDQLLLLGWIVKEKHEYSGNLIFQKGDYYLIPYLILNKKTISWIAQDFQERKEIWELVGDVNYEIIGDVNYVNIEIKKMQQQKHEYQTLNNRATLLNANYSSKQIKAMASKHKMKLSIL